MANDIKGADVLGTKLYPKQNPLVIGAKVHIPANTGEYGVIVSGSDGSWNGPYGHTEKATVGTVLAILKFQNPCFFSFDNPQEGNNMTWYKYDSSIQIMGGGN